MRLFTKTAEFTFEARQKCLDLRQDLQDHKIGKHYFAIGQHADLWKGRLLSEFNGCKIVGLFGGCKSDYADPFLFFKVAFKIMRGGFVVAEKRPELREHITRVRGVACRLSRQII
jgi:hypothetical protein